MALYIQYILGQFNQEPTHFNWFKLILLLASLIFCTFILSWTLQKYANKLKSGKWRWFGFILGLWVEKTLILRFGVVKIAVFSIWDFIGFISLLKILYRLVNFRILNPFLKQHFLCPFHQLFLVHVGWKILGWFCLYGI